MPVPPRSTWTKFSRPENSVFTNVHRLSGQGVAHAHDFLEIAIIAGGRCTHVSQDGTVPARLGDVFVLRPGSWHWYVDCADLVLANCCIAAEALRSEYALMRGIPEINQLLWTGPMGAGHGVSALRLEPSAAEMALSELADLRTYLTSRHQRHAIVLGRLLTVLGLLATPIDSSMPREGAGGVAVVAHALEAEPERPWTLDELAALANLVPTYLSTVFHRQVGLPPFVYLTRVRVERAAILLARTTMSVAEVGAAVGWSDPSYFTRRFRHTSGLSPRAYRNRFSDSVQSEGRDPRHQESITVSSARVRGSDGPHEHLRS